jgi:hypothetical protein
VRKRWRQIHRLGLQVGLHAFGTQFTAQAAGFDSAEGCGHVKLIAVDTDRAALDSFGQVDTGGLIGCPPWWPR